MAFEKPVMDEKTYTDNMGEMCPFCRCGGNLHVMSDFDVDTTSAHRDVNCGDCGTTFREYFHLAGFEPIDKDPWK